MPDGYLYKRREPRDADGAAHYLTFSYFRRLSLFDHDAIKDRFVERLSRLNAPILAWVVMPTHVHLFVVRVDDRSMADTLREIKTPFAREVINRWKRLEWEELSRLLTRRVITSGKRAAATTGSSSVTNCGKRSRIRIAIP